MKKLNKLMIVLLIVLLLIGVSSITLNVYSNITLKSSFRTKETAYPYEQAVINHNIDLGEISKIFPTASAPLGFNYIKKITLSTPISYYENINDNTPVYTIRKGDVIYFNVIEFGSPAVAYQGIASLPTNIRGWRLARPFKVEGENNNNNLLYVKLSDLEGVSKIWLDKNPKAITAMSSHIQGLFPTTQEYVNLIVLRLDQLLYEEGIYLSPDLNKPILSSLAYVTFALAFVISMLYLFFDKIYVRK